MLKNLESRREKEWTIQTKPKGPCFKPRSSACQPTCWFRRVRSIWVSVLIYVMLCTTLKSKSFIQHFRYISLAFQPKRKSFTKHTLSYSFSLGLHSNFNGAYRTEKQSWFHIVLTRLLLKWTIYVLMLAGQFMLWIAFPNHRCIT